MKSERNDSIQGLRGIAALLVVAAHSILNLIWRAQLDPHAAQLTYRLGELGVKTFFMISGFIMTVTMYDQFGRKGAPTSFLLKRLMRIVPLYWLATGLYALRLAAEGHTPRWTDLVLSLLFLPYDHGQPFREPVYGLGWTLNYEMFFYALFSLSLLLRRKLGLSLLLLAFLVLVNLSETLPVRHGFGLIHDFLYTLTAPIILFFAAGVLLGIASKWYAGQPRRLNITTDTAILASVIAAICYTTLVAQGIGLAYSVFGLILQIGFCAVPTALCAFASSDDADGPMRRLFLAVGNASYSIYLTHSFITGIGARLWARFLAGQPASTASAILFPLLMMVAASILGYISFRLIEKPSLDFLRARITHDRQRVI